MPRAKASTSKAVAVASTSNKLPVNVQEQLAQEAASIQSQIGAPSTNAISTKEKVFTLPDGTVLEGPIDLVILDFNSQNKFYEGKYDPKNPTPPACWALGKSPKGMTPSQNATDPQHTDCDSCPMNQFGSDGDGKACKNTRVLAVLPVDAEPDDEIMTLSVPPTAIKGFDAYVAQVAKMFNTPPIGVVTTIGFHPEKSYPSLIFGKPQANPNLTTHFARRAECEVLLNAEPDVSGVEAAPAKKTTGRGSRRSK